MKHSRTRQPAQALRIARKVCWWLVPPLLACLHPAMAADKSAPASSAPVDSAAMKPSPANAADCDQAAKAWFAKTYANGTLALKSGRTVKSSLSAHFSAKRGECLVRTEFESPADGKAPAVAGITLYKGHPANKASVGSVVRSGGKVVHCDFEKQPCKSVEEWQAKAAPRMKE